LFELIKSHISPLKLIYFENYSKIYSINLKNKLDLITQFILKCFLKNSIKLRKRTPNESSTNYPANR
jgi:hypothetical protein